MFVKPKAETASLLLKGQETIVNCAKSGDNKVQSESVPFKS